MISIIVTAYNIEQYIDICIKSILNQTYSDLEIILVDDGSTDSSGKICDVYAGQDQKIKVIHKENGGLVSARKTGFLAASGEWICFVDGDDWVEEDMCERLYQCLIREKVDVVICDHYTDSETYSKRVLQGLPEGRYDKDDLIHKIYPRMIENGAFFEWGVFPAMWGKLFRKDLLQGFVLAVDDRIAMGEDAACIYPYMLNARSIFILGMSLYHYRQIPVSMVRIIDNDIEKERVRFRLLYEAGQKNFEKYDDIYDLRRQWKSYLLFLMVPRADCLYEGIWELDYLFPFPEVKRGSKIVIYGAGIWGERLYRCLKQTRFCEVVALADTNYKQLCREDLKVIGPDDIELYEFDAIVITASFASVRKAIYTYLTGKYSNANIYIMDENLIKSSETWRAFGLR